MPPRHRTRAAAAVLAAAALAFHVPSAAGTAGVPVPDAINIFLGNDIVSVDNFSKGGLYTAQPTNVRVTRPGVPNPIGQASVKVSGQSVGFEINGRTTGGTCWGSGATPDYQVTPDIRSGDTVTFTLSTNATPPLTATYACPAYDITITRGFADSSEADREALVATMEGTLDAAAPAPVVTAIAAPRELRFTVVHDASIKARQGPDYVTDVTGAFDSYLEVTGTTWKAFYRFRSADIYNQIILAQGGESVSLETAAPEGHLCRSYAVLPDMSGPTRGDCPLSVNTILPAAGTITYTAPPLEVTSLELTLTAGVPLAGVDVLGYDVRVVQALPTDTDRVSVVGKELGAFAGQSTSVTMTGLDPNKWVVAVEARAKASGGRASNVFESLIAFQRR